MVKIDVITGFLGAGKTTFANLLLDHYMKKQEKTVYIVNEFGSQGLDAAITRHNGFQSIEVTNGCVCCTLKDDILLTLIQVIDTFQPDRIVFEPSGIFIAENFFEILQAETLRHRCEIGSLITIVDKKNFRLSKIKYGNFIYSQIKNTPVIIVSKLSATDTNTDEIICDVKNINPLAHIYIGDWGHLLGETLERLLWLAQPAPAQNQALAGVGLLHHPLQTMTQKLSREYTHGEIENLLSSFRHGQLGDICRIKGVMIIENQPKLINITPEDYSAEYFSGAIEPRLTFIGLSINKTAIYNRLS